jgi:hypothetical protein
MEALCDGSVQGRRVRSMAASVKEPIQELLFIFNRFSDEAVVAVRLFVEVNFTVLD